MSHETEPQPNRIDQYVLFDTGGSSFVCIPMDAFIENNADICIIERKGYGNDAEFKFVDKPIDFKMLSGEQMIALKAKARLLENTKENQDNS